MMDISVNEDQTASIKLLSKPGMTSATIVSLRIIIFLRSSGHSTLRSRRFTIFDERIVQAIGKIVQATEQIVQEIGKIVQASSGFCQHIIPLSEK